MEPRRGRNFAFLMVALGTAVLVVAGILLEQRLREQRLLSERDSANEEIRSLNEATVQLEIRSLNAALQFFVQDESEYPGADQKQFDEKTNHFPLLYNAILGRRRPKGPGGRNAPYMKIDESKVRMWNRNTRLYKLPTRSQLRDDSVEKFLIDPWDNPYIYRANKGRSKKGFMHNVRHADLYSLGPNGINDTAEATEGEENDDIGNW